jgi:hypothetical protein
MTKILFGSTAMLHGFCPRCDDNGFATPEGNCLDCKTPMNIARKVRREVKAQFKRRQPSPAYRQAQLERQAQRCYWCRREFGEYLVRRGSHCQLRVCWDHFIPFSFTGSCDDIEFVAACQVCNGIKTDHMFDTEDECRAYIVRRVARRWQSVDEAA